MFVKTSTLKKYRQAVGARGHNFKFKNLQNCRSFNQNRAAVLVTFR